MAKTEKSCVVCTELFTGNAHKTTCSPACRTKLSRMKSKGEEPKIYKKKEVAPVAIKPEKIPIPSLKDINQSITNQPKQKLSQILKGLGHNVATERKKFVPPILAAKKEATT